MKITKQIAALTVFAFMTTQVLPAGWAAVNLNDLVTGADQEKVLTKSATDTETETATAAKASAHTGVSIHAAAAVDSTTFQMGNGSTLSVTSSSPSGESESEVATSTEQAEPAPLPVAPPLGLTNEDQPATLFYTVAERNETMRQWRVPIATTTNAFVNLLLDVATSIRKFASTIWGAIKEAVRKIVVDSIDNGRPAHSGNDGLVVFDSKAMQRYFLSSRLNTMYALIHEAFHKIGTSFDAFFGFLSPVGDGHCEGSTDARALKALERIANNSANSRGWREIAGTDWSYHDVDNGFAHYFSSLTEKNVVYTVSVDKKTGERTVNRFSYGEINWDVMTLDGGYLNAQEVIQDSLVFSGKSEVYRADNTLDRIIYYEKDGRGVVPGINTRTEFDVPGRSGTGTWTNRVSVVTYYDKAGKTPLSRDNYSYAPGDRYQVTKKDAAGTVLSVNWFQIVNKKPVALAEGWNLPKNISVKGPAVDGVVTVSGTRADNTAILYSLDGGITYKLLAESGSSLSWAARITLPVGVSTLSIISRIIAIAPVSGLKTLFSSAPVVLDPITYTVPLAPAPTNIVATAPSAAGVVTLSGTRVVNTSIWYSIDGGITYTKLVAAGGSNTAWSGKLALPAGSTEILVMSKMTVDTSYKPKTMTLLGEPIKLAAITYVPPTVPVPANITVTAPTSSGVVTLTGTKAAANTTFWYSLDGGVTYKRLVISESDTKWTGKVALPGGTTTLSIIAKSTITDSGFTTCLSSEPVVLEPITYIIPVPVIVSKTVNPNGKVTLSGTVIPGQLVQYSFDGTTWLTTGASTSTAVWRGETLLPSTGIITIFVRAKLGDSYSESVSTTVSFDIPAPTVQATKANASGDVTLSGTVTKGKCVQYSIDGKTWLTADSSTTSGAWSKQIHLPAGIFSVFVRAKQGNFFSDPVAQNIVF